ncbi:MAG: hypothetical protein JW891_04225 [Candidatus Lokiarchaeota archaeon]|nr:hypothetical protein [Candidatus Lokiarchaeota archaeon]
MLTQDMAALLRIPINPTRLVRPTSFLNSCKLTTLTTRDDLIFFTEMTRKSSPCVLHEKLSSHDGRKSYLNLIYRFELDRVKFH